MVVVVDVHSRESLASLGEELHQILDHRALLVEVVRPPRVVGPLPVVVLQVEPGQEEEIILRVQKG